LHLLLFLLLSWIPESLSFYCRSASFAPCWVCFCSPCVGITPVCRTNGLLRTKLAAWPRSRAGCPKRNPLPPKSKSAPWSSGVRWRRPVWRRPNSEWPRHVPNAKRWRRLSGPNSRTSPMTFWANSRALSRRPTAKRSTCCWNLSGITSWSSASGSRRSTPPRTNSGGRCATSLNAWWNSIAASPPKRPTWPTRSRAIPKCRATGARWSSKRSSTIRTWSGAYITIRSSISRTKRETTCGPTWCFICPKANGSSSTRRCRSRHSSDTSGPRTRRPGASILRRTSRRCGSTSSNWVARSTSDCSIRPISSLCSFPTNRRFWRRCKTTAPSGPMPTTRKSSSLRRPIFSLYWSWWTIFGSGTHRIRIRPTSLLTVRNSTSSWWLSPLRSKGWDSRSTPPGTSTTMPTSGFAPVTTTSSAAGSGFANWEFRPRNNSLPGLCRRPIYRTKS
jgi:Uncharacterized protein conserved in bacteria